MYINRIIYHSTSTVSIDITVNMDGQKQAASHKDTDNKITERTAHKQIESPQITMAYTFSHPSTMMIIVTNTYITDPAMSCVFV